MMKKFPDDFTWGSSTSCYQIEGAYQADGKGLSIWDVFSHTPGKIQTGETGDIACDHYHKYKEDIQLMADIGLQAYRFSISWTRIIPDGKGDINLAGIRYYRSIIETLRENNIEPWPTLHHWDLPIVLQMEHDGWLNEITSDYFARFAEVCFEHFGDLAHNWITFNEPWVMAIQGHHDGIFAPGRKSTIEPYLAAHHMILAHAKAAKIFHEKYQPKYGGQIGMANNCDWREPKTDTPEDHAAAQRAVEFFLGWFADPLYLGDYPFVMKEQVGSRMPIFTQEQKQLINGSCDFFGLNHYTTQLASHVPSDQLVENDIYGNAGIFEDQYVALENDPNWPQTDMRWSIVPWGMRKLLHWINNRYDSPTIYITENGCASPDQVVNGQVNDQARIDFLKAYIAECHQAIQEGVSIKGYFVWSFLDNFEWIFGYTKRFGLHYIDYQTLERIPKASAYWYQELIAKNGLSEE